MRRSRNQSTIVAVALILAALGLVILALRTSLVSYLNSALVYPMAPIVSLFNGGTRAAADLAAPAQDYETLKKRNAELERTVAEMQVEIVRLREIEQDYQRLSKLANYTSAHPDVTVITAEVIGLDTSSYLRWVMINRGVRDGIRNGNPVISDMGFVGIVEDVAANAAWVRLVIDPSITINARLQTSRADGVISGLLQGGLQMSLIPQGAIVKDGDLVLTSGLGGNLPADIVIGQVVSARHQPAELFQQADVRPTVDFARLEIVTVITGFEPIDTSNFQNISPAPSP